MRQVPRALVLDYVGGSGLLFGKQCFMATVPKRHKLIPSSPVLPSRENTENTLKVGAQVMPWDESVGQQDSVWAKLDRGPCGNWAATSTLTMP